MFLRMEEVSVGSGADVFRYPAGRFQMRNPPAGTSSEARNNPTTPLYPKESLVKILTSGWSNFHRKQFGPTA